MQAMMSHLQKFRWPPPLPRPLNWQETHLALYPDYIPSWDSRSKDLSLFSALNTGALISIMPFDRMWIFGPLYPSIELFIPLISDWRVGAVTHSKELK